MDRRTDGWIDTLLSGAVPPYVKAVPVKFLDLLKAYLMHLRVEHKRTPATVYGHGRSLVYFFVWLGNNAPQVTMDGISADHIAHFLAYFQVDGRVQGRDTRREGNRKAVRTMYSKITILRAFFAWALLQRHCSANPAEQFHIDWGPRDVFPLPEAKVAELLKTWRDPSSNPRTAAVGLLCLVYGLTSSQIVTLPLSAVDVKQGVFRGLAVPVPIPEWLRLVLERYMNWRQELLGGRSCDYFVVTHRLHSNPAHGCLIFRMLKPYGVHARQLRDTAIAQTIQYGHLKLLTVFGLHNDSMRRYEGISRLVQNTRKVHAKPNLW
jgi:site-specific recombinase XerD